MSWLDWLKGLFTRPVTRDVSRLDAPVDASGRAVDRVRETVAMSGPLKPGHRRQIIRDARLLPKGPRRYTPNRMRLMSASEARRRFSATLRTRNREQGDLLPDEAQLARYGLPVWRTEEELATALRVSVGQLRHYSIHRSRERVSHYVTFAVRKRSGGLRHIHAPKRRLKALQRRLLDLLVSKLPVSAHAHGFVTGRSIKTGAAPHVGRRVVLKLDLKDFFPSVTFARVRGLLIALGYGYPVAATLAVLMTEAERQPVEVEGTVFHVPVGPRVCVQGAPTSPGLCNAVLLRLDRRLAGLARRYGYTYTRYADDLTFSGDDVAALPRVRALAARYVRDEGFEVNGEKTRVQRKGGAQRVTGVTVNTELGLSRQERRRLRAMIHQEGRDGEDAKEEARIDGLLAYVKMLNPEQAARLAKRRKSRGS
ncbi:reverse transcriptase family protein [Pyxidicoccus xibeiensis]|uniref:reverse transcriptase family protein n=1 Tax=Pyxidicoccus xibeiensis TaxID=2906759 RepID=UPI0020A73DA9|nr:reverse transcriptase family protein [Pyxidicoccus xibeiensis]MCP3139979.1 reverse transcriptase family protein [Pyxidicoccus xibeiensis]